MHSGFASLRFGDDDVEAGVLPRSLGERKGQRHVLKEYYYYNSHNTIMNGHIPDSGCLGSMPGSSLEFVETYIICTWDVACIWQRRVPSGLLLRSFL